MKLTFARAVTLVFFATSTFATTLPVEARSELIDLDRRVDDVDEHGVDDIDVEVREVEAYDDEADLEERDEFVELEARSDATKLTQKQAEAKLKPQGIKAVSSGGCTSKSGRTCTSYSGIRTGTVNGVIALKKAAKLSSLIVTGGTEVGHASGTQSHSNGFKLDLRHSTALDKFIKAKFKKIATRSDGAKQFRSPAGNIYADEGNHWDVTFKVGKL